MSVLQKRRSLARSRRVPDRR